LTSEEEGRLRSRLQAISSLRQIYEIISDLVEFESTSHFPLPFLLLKSVLQDLAWRLEGLIPNNNFMEIFGRIQQQIMPGFCRILDASRATNQVERLGLLEELNMVAGQWIMLRQELR